MHDNTSDSTTQTDSDESREATTSGAISLEDVEALIDERVQEATADLREQLAEERKERRALEERLADVEDTADSNAGKADRNMSRVTETKNRVAELQSRELEKGAHLASENIDTGRLTVANDKVEVFEGDDGTEFVRQPGEADPLERSGESVLATADLLPIQQLARMDDDMLASATSTRPDYIAARVWAERGQHSPGSVWSAGGPEVAEYLDASDVRTFIKANLQREDENLTYDYAKKLAGEALERIRELAKDRGYIQRRNHRKDGLRYKERRFVLPSDAEIPGEGTTDAPVTDGVTG